jgi:MoxR-like ATPase
MQANTDIQALQQKINDSKPTIDKLIAHIGQTIIGQRYMIDRLLIGLLTNGHILLEGVPGLAKTLAIKSLAAGIGGSFHRIQFTPDLLPADVIGTMIYNLQRNEFQVKKGPIFANFILADEINRAPAKVQSALLEAMQERQVSIGDTTYPLDNPFLVLATQNPIDQEGTYTLPEAQVDRFLLKVVISYPSKEEEQLIIRQHLAPTIANKQTVLEVQDILKARELVYKIYLDAKIEQYIVDIVFATRQPAEYGLQNHSTHISYGASPRASIALALAAKAQAYLNNRAYVIPEDVRSIALDVLRHRIGISYEGEAAAIDSTQIVAAILNKIQVP